MNVPLFIQIRNKLLSQIETGVYIYGEQFPTEEALSKEFKTDRKTIRKAKHILVNDGVLIAVKGKGTFIAQPKINYSLANKEIAESFTAISLRLGFEPKNKLIKAFKFKANKKYGKIFNVPEDTLMYRLIRIRYNEKIPMAVENVVILYDLITNIEEIDFEMHSLYEVLFSRGVVFVDGMTVVNAEFPPREVLKALQIPEDRGVFKLEFFEYGAEQKLYEYTEFYSPDERLLINLN